MHFLIYLEEIKAPTHAKDRKTRREWENYIQDLNKDIAKLSWKNCANGLLDRTDPTGAMEKIRWMSFLNLMDEISRRYSPYGESRSQYARRAVDTAEL